MGNWEPSSCFASLRSAAAPKHPPLGGGGKEWSAPGVICSSNAPGCGGVTGNIGWHQKENGCSVTLSVHILKALFCITASWKSGKCWALLHCGDTKHSHILMPLASWKSQYACVDWRSMCSEVTQLWLNNQEQIEGNNIVVETDETLLVRRKRGVGRIPQQVWVFGGIERVTKKRFIVPLLDEIDTNVSEPRSKDILIPYILKYIWPDSIHSV